MGKKWNLGKQFEESKHKPEPKAAAQPRPEARLRPPAAEPEGFGEDTPKPVRPLSDRQKVDDRPQSAPLPPPEAVDGSSLPPIGRAYSGRKDEPPGAGDFDNLSRRMRRISSRERTLLGITFICLLIAGAFWAYRLLGSGSASREADVRRVLQNIGNAAALFEMDRERLPDSMDELARTDYLGGDPSETGRRIRFFYAPLTEIEFALWEAGPNGKTALDQGKIHQALMNDLLKLNDTTDDDDSLVVFRVESGTGTTQPLFTHFPATR
ncbi:hypothetical protein KQI84_18450 [bacterium]|nr:hypothetical protein [bacterium]